MARQKPNSSSSKQLTETRAKAGKKGGEAGRGEAKVRSYETVAKGGRVRWQKYHEKKAEEAKQAPPEAPED
ncbi:hypothetical protein GCM10023213_19880 [Prosthecobacter algae]|uniref:Uncharacterized protein n=1 Tax=Prosthecobacter algae TaxID=1144682 RepID=A0ABP9P261_9BACT